MSQEDASVGTLHHVISEGELGQSERVITAIEGREIAVFNVDEEYHAVANYCIHQGGPACEGLLSGSVSLSSDWELSYDFEGEIVACPWHGWEFDVKTGKHLADSAYALPTYDTVVDDGEIYVRL